MMRVKPSVNPGFEHRSLCSSQEVFLHPHRTSVLSPGIEPLCLVMRYYNPFRKRKSEEERLKERGVEEDEEEEKLFEERKEMRYRERQQRGEQPQEET